MPKNGKTIKCEFCGKLIYRPLARLNKYKHHFCSAFCATRRCKNGQNVICEFCGKTFYRTKFNIKKKNYCSPQCFAKSLVTSKKVRCAYCNKELLRKPSRIKKSKKYMFCSRNHFLLFYQNKKIKCFTCDKLIYKRPSTIKQNKNNFCSKECYYVYNRNILSKTKNKQIKKICEFCEKEFKTKQSYSKKRFCSKFNRKD